MDSDSDSKAIAAEAWSQLVHSIVSDSPPSDMGKEYYYTIRGRGFDYSQEQLKHYKYKLGTENIQDRMRFGMHSQVVGANQHKQGINEHIQDCIRSAKHSREMLAYEDENEQGIEHIRHCIRSGNHSGVLQTYEDKSRQGIDHIQYCVRSNNNYSPLHVYGNGIQQGTEYIQDCIRSKALFQPPEDEDKFSISNIRATARSREEPEALQEPKDNKIQSINYKQAKQMLTWFDDLLELVENEHLHKEGELSLQYEVLQVIKLLHHYGLDTIRTGVEDNLEDMKQKYDNIEKDPVIQSLMNGLEVMLKICDNVTCQATIYEIICKAERDQLFFDYESVTCEDDLYMSLLFAVI